MKIIFLLSFAVFAGGCQHIAINYKSNTDSIEAEVLDETTITPRTEVGL